MVSKTKMCPSGHVIPTEALSCPICNPGATREMEKLEGPSAKTRVDFDLEATRVEDLPKTLLELEGGRPFLGWLAITEGKFSGEAFHLYEGKNIVGSSSSCHIQIPDEGIEGQHLSIRFSYGKWMITDLDSDEGTFLNGKRIHRTELKDGDKIKIGKAALHLKIL